MKRLLLLTIIIGQAIISTPAFAERNSGTLMVSATVISACRISSNGIDFNDYGTGTSHCSGNTGYRTYLSRLHIINDGAGSPTLQPNSGASTLAADASAATDSLDTAGINAAALISDISGVLAQNLDAEQKTYSKTFIYTIEY